jgi:hypothetical protein
MSDRTAPDPPTWDAYNAACAAIEKHRERADQAEQRLDNLRGRMTAMADEYERATRLITSGAFGAMLREWAETAGPR